MPKTSHHKETPAVDAVRRTQLHAGARSGVVPRGAPPTALATALALALATEPAAPIGSPGVAPNEFAQTDLIANKASFGPKRADRNLTNAWRLPSSATSAIWV
jgi:hypothetical protein